MARTRAVSRETLRDAVRLWPIPFCAVRTSRGSAAFRAAAAAFLSPEAMASSTPRTVVLRREWRFLLISVRRCRLRSALRADVVFAIENSDHIDGLAGRSEDGNASDLENRRGTCSPRLRGARYSDRDISGQRKLTRL